VLAALDEQVQKAAATHASGAKDSTSSTED
jgi:hypothetical protein